MAEEETQIKQMKMETTKTHKLEEKIYQSMASFQADTTVEAARGKQLDDGPKRFGAGKSCKNADKI